MSARCPDCGVTTVKGGAGALVLRHKDDCPNKRVPQKPPERAQPDATSPVVDDRHPGEVYPAADPAPVSSADDVVDWWWFR